jgi:hypothetical protein
VSTEEITQRDAVLDLYPEIKMVARRVASTWAGTVDEDDLIGDIVIRLIGDGQATAVWNLDPPARKKGLNIVARQIASDQREAFDHFHGKFNYTTNEVRLLLGRRALSRDQDYEVNETNDWQNGEVVASSSLQINVDNIDLRVAFAKLSNKYQNILLDQFDGQGYEGHSQDITLAVDSLTREMNRSNKRRWSKHEGPGSRRAMSNASARGVVQANN